MKKSYFSINITLFIFLAVLTCLFHFCKPRNKNTITEITVHEIGSGFTWCYKGGLKQGLGAYQKGLSIVQITRTFNSLGNPDFICWVNEKTGRYGISKQPTGNTQLAINPGGNVTFDREGYIWFTYGARSQDMAFDLYRSERPHDLKNFKKQLNNYISKKDDGSTSIKVFVNENKVMLQWRQFGSTVPIVKARHRRYDMSDFSTYENQVDIGTGIPNICIEQVWSRFDPRFDYLISSFHFFQQSPRIMGAAPYLYSEDYGTSWLKPNGKPYTKLPLDYFETSLFNVIPWDHIKDGYTGSWIEFESGVSPKGKHWMICPTGADVMGKFFVWNQKNQSWDSTLTIGPIRGQLGGFSCGATKDKLLLAYTNNNHPNKLYVVVSSDSGANWSNPFLLDTLKDNEQICWVSYCQPSTSYENNYGRFFYAYNQTGNNSQNNIKFVRFMAK